MGEDRIKYRFGRSAFCDFETGNRKEWLLSNGIGGYANSTVHGNSSRIFSAYLIASLHPPVDRVLVLAKTHEELIFHTQEPEEEETQREKLLARNGAVTAEASTEGVGVVRRDFATQQYPGYVREGYRYQTGFTFDFWPEYRYFSDGISVCKRIALAYGKNEVAISYTIENHSRQEAVFSVTPLFNFRPFGEVSGRSSLVFDVRLNGKNPASSPDLPLLSAGGELILTPASAPDYQIRFAASEGDFYDRGKRKTSMATPDYRIEENELYCVDVSNGFTGVDHHFTPYELHIDLAPGEKKEVGLLCELLGGQALVSGAQGEKEKVPQNGNSRPDILSRARQIFDAAQARGEQLLAQAGSKDALTGRLVLSADHFLVWRESTGLMTVLAGYPWFADWGRDTMIAFTGLTLATRRFAQARDVLRSFAKYISRGMLPNVFPNHANEEPMYNTIDASLWYFYAAYKYLQYTTGLPCYQESWKGGKSDIPAGKAEKAAENGAKAKEQALVDMEGCGQDLAEGNEVPGVGLSEDEIFIRDEIYPALCEIFESYRSGAARYGIHMEEDGLIAGGGGLDQLTWMDVRVGNIVVTPRHGKAVEINALWYNAICCMRLFKKRFGAAGADPFGGARTKDGRSAAKSVPVEELEQLAVRVRRSFEEKFWNPSRGCLYDTVDENGRGDDALRPNQIFAVSLPFTMLPPEKERSIVRVVYEKLYTPYGLRSLAPEENGYRGEYRGRLILRDLAYHMGTAWGYLAGAFFDAWAKTMCQGAQEKEFLLGMIENFADHMADGCLGGIAEIFDGDFACGSRGCYTQAWSVAEVLRAWRELGGR